MSGSRFDGTGVRGGVGLESSGREVLWGFESRDWREAITSSRTLRWYDASDREMAAEFRDLEWATLSRNAAIERS